jgi:cytochrome b6-f complex iron-sulfur subunit
MMADEQENILPRRDFLGLSWRIIAALAFGQGTCMGLRFLASRKAEGSFGQLVTAGLVADFPPGTITPFETERFLLVRFEDGGFLALYTKCTHLACAVSWNEQRQRFVCPCHGSEFQQDGDVLNPPAPRPLDRFPVTIADDGRVEVDTRERIQRTETSPDELVYEPAPADQGRERKPAAGRDRARDIDE